MDNKFNEVFPSFDPLNAEFSPSSHLVIVILSLLNHLHTLIISDASIKNNIAMSISHIHVYNKPIVKIVRYATNITITEVVFFAIRCGVDQAVNLLGIWKIIVIMDSIHAARSIFNSSIHPFQIYLAVISKELEKFFLTNNNNSIEFWEYSSHCNWPLFKVIDRDTKWFCQTLLLSSKLLWDFSKKKECDNIIWNWKIMFQASNQKS